MSGMKFLFLFLCISFVVACKKNSLTAGSFTGKWKLIATLADPGDGSGQWQPVTGTDKFIRFNADSSLESNIYTDYKRYRVSDSVRIEFIQSNGTSILLRYKFYPSMLQINSPCIEPCGARFTKE